MLQQKIITLWVHALPVKVIFSKRRTVSLEIKAANAVARVPLHTSPLWLKRFLHERYPWLQAHHAKQQRLQHMYRVDPAQQGHLLYLGVTVPIQIQTQVSTSGVVYEAGTLSVLIGQRSRKPLAQKVNELLQSWLKKQAQTYFDTRVQYWSSRMGLTPSRVDVATFKSSWGQCNSRGRIALNWHLMMAPPAAIDYVVIHELAHLEEMNHSARFWAIVRQFCPDAELHRTFFKARGVWLTWR